MPAYRFANGERFLWNAELYEIDKLLPDGYVQFHHTTLQKGTVETVAKLDEEWLSGRLEFVRHQSDTSTLVPTRPRKSLNDFDPALAEIARWRLWVISPFIDFTAPAREADIEARVLEVKASLTPEQRELSQYRISKSTLRAWIKLFRDSGGEVEALVPHWDLSGGPGQSRLHPLVEEIVRNVITGLILDNRLGATNEEVSDEVNYRIKEVNLERIRTSLEPLTCPDPSTVWRRTNELLQEQAMAKLQAQEEKPPRKGARPWKSRRKLQPLEEVEMDLTELDLIAVNDERTIPIGRMQFVSSICGRIGYPLGRYIGFEPESHYATLECLYHSILPKLNVRETYGTQNDWLSKGIPLKVRIDRGKGFNNQHLEDAASLLGFELDVLPPRTPFLKPFIERYFRSSNNGLTHYLDGTTFSNFAQRGDYDSLQAATLTCFEIDSLLHQYLLDIYAEKPLTLRRLGGLTRAQQWQELTQPPFSFRMPRTARDLLIDLGWVEWRTINDYGIEIDYLRYNSRKLPRLRQIWGNAKAKIKRHPGDKSRIYVIDPEADLNKDPNATVYVEIPAVDQEYTQGLSSWAHQLILNYQRETLKLIDRSKFAEARRRMRSMMQEAREQKRGVRSQERAERFFSTPPSLTPQIANASPEKSDVDDAPSEFLITEADLELPQGEQNKWRLVKRDLSHQVDLEEV